MIHVLAVPGGIEPPFAGWKPAVLTDRRRDHVEIFYFKSHYLSSLINFYKEEGYRDARILSDTLIRNDKGSNTINNASLKSFFLKSGHKVFVKYNSA